MADSSDSKNALWNPMHYFLIPDCHVRKRFKFCETKKKLNEGTEIFLCIANL